MSTDSRDVGWRAVMTDITAAQVRIHHLEFIMLNLQVGHLVHWVNMFNAHHSIMCYHSFAIILFHHCLDKEIRILIQHRRNEDNYLHLHTLKLTFILRGKKSRKNCVQTHTLTQTFEWPNSW